MTSGSNESRSRLVLVSDKADGQYPGQIHILTGYRNEIDSDSVSRRMRRRGKERERESRRSSDRRN